jgi:hypothetical protein
MSYKEEAQAQRLAANAAVAASFISEKDVKKHDLDEAIDTVEVGEASHPNVAEHEALGLAPTSHAHAHNHDAAYSASGHGHTHDHDADYEALGHTHQGGDHPDLATHNTLGLATQTELDTVASAKADVHTHPYEASGAVATHAAAGDPHAGYLTPAEHTTGLSGHHTSFVQADHDALANPHHSSANDHARQHSITSASDHTFPGGTTTYLRADGTFATPAGGGGEAFPVGSVFISVVSTNPATLLGYGTWSAFGAGRVLVGLDSGDTAFDTVEETGGAKTHQLTEAEMPAHVHNQTRLPTATGGVTGFTVDTSMSGTPATSGVDTGSKGGGGAHNNLQPYIVTYMWKRTA